MSQKKLRKLIRKQFDADALKRICEAEPEHFAKYGKRYDLEGKDRYFYYGDNGSGILAIAHLDSVQADGTCRVRNTAAGLMVTSGTLDDRLGAYIICELLPRLGVKCDILLTTDEESCASTAGQFDVEKKYNWMIQFDRGGTDVVMYDYETPELAKMVKDSGATVGAGSFSDICMLEHLGVAGFNWGCGYQDYHSARSHAWLEDTFQMVGHFLKFHAAHKSEVMPYEHVARGSLKYSGYFGDDAWPDKTATELEFCPECRNELRLGLCRDCGIDYWDRYTGAESVSAVAEQIRLDDYRAQSQ